MSRLESEFVKQAFDSNYIAPLGPMVDAFEREFPEKVEIPYGSTLNPDEWDPEFKRRIKKS